MSDLCSCLWLWYYKERIENWEHDREKRDFNFERTALHLNKQQHKQLHKPQIWLIPNESCKVVKKKVCKNHEGISHTAESCIGKDEPMWQVNRLRVISQKTIKMAYSKAKVDRSTRYLLQSSCEALRCNGRWSCCFIHPMQDFTQCRLSLAAQRPHREEVKDAATEGEMWFDQNPDEVIPDTFLSNVLKLAAENPKTKLFGRQVYFKSDNVTFCFLSPSDIPESH